MKNPRALALLEELVAIDSVNPAFGGPGEAAIAARVAGELEALGLEVERREPEAGRVSVLGRLPGTGGGRSLMLYAHLDTVGTEGMESPLVARVTDGRLFGRGAYDMKAGLVACLEAARALTAMRPGLRGDLYVAAVADEEEASRGMMDVLEACRPDAAIVTEPTELALCLAHKGFCWIEVRTEGRAAHGSRFEEGIDANLGMGRVLAELSGLERRLRESERHPLVGPPSLHVPVMEGGTGPSTYAASCRIVIERRTVPGETPQDALAEIEAILARLRAAAPGFRANARLLLSRPPFEVPAAARIVRAVESAASEVLGRPPRRIGHSFWMDAALLADAGVETAVLGHSGGGAHGAGEWVEIESMYRLAEVLTRAAEEYCG